MKLFVIKFVVKCDKFSHDGIIFHETVAAPNSEKAARIAAYREITKNSSSPPGRWKEIEKHVLDREVQKAKKESKDECGVWTEILSVVELKEACDSVGTRIKYSIWIHPEDAVFPDETATQDKTDGETSKKYVRFEK